VARVESFFSQVLKLTPDTRAGEESVVAAALAQATASDPDLIGTTLLGGLGEGGDTQVRFVPQEPGTSGQRPASGEDSMLIRRLSAGEEEALGTLMDRYGGALLHFAHRLTGDMQLAEEIWQDTMLKAWQQASSFRVDGHLKAWLFRVARNNAIDHMRKKRVPIEEYTVCLETAATTHRPEKEAERSWLSAEVYEAIDDLPPAYREVIDLRFFHQLCYQEISGVLRIPLGTVKSRLNYAIQRLTKILRDRGIDHQLVDN
jgi:RNA polymerase sigma-70 factor (ECF subfamily)